MGARVSQELSRKDTWVRGTHAKPGCSSQAQRKIPMGAGTMPPRRFPRSPGPSRGELWPSARQCSRTRLVADRPSATQLHASPFSTALA